MLTVNTVASLVMVKLTRSVKLPLTLSWVHSTETSLQVVVEFVLKFEFCKVFARE